MLKDALYFLSCGIGSAPNARAPPVANPPGVAEAELWSIRRLLVGKTEEQEDEEEEEEEEEAPEPSPPERATLTADEDDDPPPYFRRRPRDFIKPRW